MKFLERLRHISQNNAGKPAQENVQNRRALESAFRTYTKHFSLTNDDVQKPLLDIGAGDGSFIGYLRKVLKNTRAYGVENRIGIVRPCQEGIVVGNGLHLPFGNETFDIVTARQYFTMLVESEEKEMRQAIGEALRVLKKGGKILGTIATPDSSATDLKRLPRRTRTEDTFRAEKRVEGAKKLEQFLQELQGNGYRVDYGASKEWFNMVIKAPIVTIHKL
ncbi:hypothetical protein A3C86_02210 [Candidatus Kaiserbacteria bacterium RIFCSPHIGHO2_02_FULL_49_16]|uniref:Methyltransferase type 11 domain-containing protein n=2 Tax=Parcubacteria group TaxID=1794811 RepID=A0A0G1WF79_9BACT|nr:MAG: hypothetical protein UY58_C0003G0015 [Candidatus Magasanikbacteria bacterium GW2011_GWA2_50_22]OGG58758.1 MAG: hypothetical protein A3C86_02210 [Candidatus Kaiserbacteria bacterium RIFCSPHIGHO2_02_FULL_49_16]